ncbi:DUF2069 domain-containing protein [Aliikangiella sp. IMCC44359]|uniref:DUF2069 domain-containing protein n=1 Tax=Aliikangiella sp. IMCC44359 TaxID=3459125 RepID=UPI00403B0B7D
MSTKPLTSQMLIAHRLTLLGYFGLILLVPIWNLLWFPSASFNNEVLTGLWLLPLLFPAVGLLKGKAYTHAWSGFIAVIYICHGLTSLLTNPDELSAILLELIFSSLFLFAGMYYAKWRGEQLGLQLPKNR